MDLFLERHLDWLKESGDEAFDWEDIFENKKLVGKVVELGDGPIIGMFTKQINKWLSPKIPDNVKEELHQVFDKVIGKNYNEALVELSDVAVVILENREVDPKYMPWINIAIEIYKGIVLGIMPKE